MKINDLLEAKFSKPILAYHATHKNNLRTILKMGLLAKQGGGFGSDVKSSEAMRDMTPVNSAVYFTNSLVFASLIGNRLSKGDGEYVIVEASVQMGSAAIDEDNFETKLNSLLQPRGSSEAVLTLLRILYQEDFSNRLLSHVIERWPIFEKVNKEKLLELCKANLMRTISYLPKNKLEQYLLKHITYISRGDEETENKIMSEFYDMIVDPKEAEDQYKKLLAWATKILKHTIKNIETSYDFSNTSFRVDDDITYKGNNKIVGVFLINEEDKTITVYYGNAQSIIFSEKFDRYKIIKDVNVK